MRAPADVDARRSMHDDARRRVAADGGAREGPRCPRRARLRAPAPPPRRAGPRSPRPRCRPSRARAPSRRRRRSPSRRRPACRCARRSGEVAPRGARPASRPDGRCPGTRAAARWRPLRARPRVRAPARVVRARVLPGVREMVGEPLDQPEVVMREVTEGRRARHHAHARVPGELCQAPASQASAISPSMLAAQPSSSEPPGSGLLVGDDHASAARGGRERRGEPGRPGADDQHVAMREALRVAVRVGLRRRTAKARGAADQRLIERRPGRARPHERLVVEAGREDRRQEIVRPPKIEAQLRPAVLRMRLEPVVELDLGRAQVRRLARRITIVPSRARSAPRHRR